MRHRVLLGAVLVGLAAVALLPLAAPSIVTLLSLIFAKGIVVLGIVVLLQAGQVSFGHAMFFAAGAYAVAFYGRTIGPGDMLVYLVFGAAAGGALGLAVGLFVVRYREIFFGMLNLAFSMVLWSLLEKIFHVTNGADGIRVARPALAGIVFTPERFSFVLLWLTFAVAVVSLFAVQRYLESPLGGMLRAIKGNETRLEYLGVSARGVLLAGYVVSAVLAGLGGTGHALGAFAGAAAFEAVRFYASAQLADAWQMILGAVLIAIILLAPSGLIGLLRLRLGSRAA